MKGMGKSVRESVQDKYLRPVLVDLLSQCTKKQQAFFLRMYPGGVEELAVDKIPNVIRQCERTIEKNLQKGNEGKV